MPRVYITLVIAVLLLVLPLVQLVREVRALRAAGISNSQPACGKCRYRMRSWGSPVCPECGSDVREAGIITGSTRVRGFAGYVATLATVIVALVSYLVACAIKPAGMTRVTSTTIGIVSNAFHDRSLSGSIELKSVQVGRSQPHEVDGAVVLNSLNDRGEPDLEKRLGFPRVGTPPSREALRAAIATVAANRLDAAALDAHAAELEGYLGRLAIDPEARFAVAPSSQSWLVLAAPVMSTTKPTSVGLTFLAVPILFLLVAAVLTDRWFPKPRSEPRDGEWM